ncbi:hypothetical protein [Caulobacter sp. X]|uniref:hypothetical protein n=1 Tax=Caulobacter sp. X TaxID=2048901 RepID=UPI000C1536BF|nr:hypothetical protein [Caulobacter sp. X]PIB96478.1 hypothetical protein CSW60_18390 [Caulobacter sp. X]
MERLFDSMAFAGELRAKLAERAPLSGRSAAIEAGVSNATFSRALSGEPNLSHESYLRLKNWIDGAKEERRAA